jgi:type IV pilus assembly protein PilX
MEIKLMRNNFNQTSTFQKISIKQKGAVLITGLIFLVVLTMLVLSIMRSATLEERMASNARNRQIALQAAEAVVRDAEENILGDTAVSPINPMNRDAFTADCTKGFCGKDVSADQWKTINWDDTAADAPTRTFFKPAAGAALNLIGISQPRYYIQYLRDDPAGTGCPLVLYRIVARGVGPDSSTVFVMTNFRYQPDDILNSGSKCGS